MTFIISQICGWTGWIFVPRGFQLGLITPSVFSWASWDLLVFLHAVPLRLHLFKAWRMGTEMVLPRDEAPELKRLHLLPKTRHMARPRISLTEGYPKGWVLQMHFPGIHLGRSLPQVWKERSFSFKHVSIWWNPKNFISWEMGQVSTMKVWSRL